MKQEKNIESRRCIICGKIECCSPECIKKAEDNKNEGDRRVDRDQELRRLLTFMRDIKFNIQIGCDKAAIEIIEDLEREFRGELGRMNTPRFRFIDPETGEVKEFNAKDLEDARTKMQEWGFSLDKFSICEKIN